MKNPSFANIGIQFVNKAVQDAIRRCERIVVVGSSDEYQKIYFFTGQKSYFRSYTIDLKVTDNIVPKRFQQAKRETYEEVLRNEPLAQAVNRVQASHLLTTYSTSSAVQSPSAMKSNMTLMRWVNGLLTP
jgi:hypothetical protein